MVIIDYKDNKKKHEFFVVPWNGQMLLSMPDAAALNIINLNTDSTEAVRTWKENCSGNIGDANKPNIRQETHMVRENCTNIDEDLKIANNVNGANDNNSINNLTNHFLSSPNVEVDKKKSIELTHKIHNVFDDVFNGIGCFKGTFSLQLKSDSKPYQAPLRHVAYVLQNHSRMSYQLQKLDIITPLGIDDTVEWCNSFVLVPKANGKVRLCLDCLDPAKLSQALIRPVHRGPTLIIILPRLNNVKYISIIDASLGYHNLKLDRKSSYLTTFKCPFG